MDFCLKIKNKFPQQFFKKRVLDIGSFNNKCLFKDCSYDEIDIGVERSIEISKATGSYDTIIAAECFEYDPFYELSILNLIHRLNPKGLFIIVCVNSPDDDAIKNYYQTITEKSIECCLDLTIFSEFSFEKGSEEDLYFYGIKK